MEYINPMSKEIINPIYQGADQDITLQVKDATGAAYDLSTAVKLVVFLHYLGGNVFAKYSMNAASGYKDLDVTDADDGKLYFKIESGETKTAKPGKIYAEMRAQFSNVDYDDGAFDLIGGGIYMGEIIASVSGNITLP